MPPVWVRLLASIRTALRRRRGGGDAESSDAESSGAESLAAGSFVAGSFVAGSFPAGGPASSSPDPPRASEPSAPSVDAQRAGRRNERLGRLGENAAVAALRAAGYRVLGRRVRTPAGEIDVVALDGRTIAIVEVKSSAARGGLSPTRRVDHAKRERLRLAWRAIARAVGHGTSPYRFDVVSVRFDDGRPVASLYRGAFRSRA